MVDLIIYGGTVVTIDKDRRVINDGGVVIDKGLIVFIGTSKATRPCWSWLS